MSVFMLVSYCFDYPGIVIGLGMVYGHYTWQCSETTSDCELLLLGSHVVLGLQGGVVITSKAAVLSPVLFPRHICTGFYKVLVLFIV